MSGMICERVIVSDIDETSRNGDNYMYISPMQFYIKQRYEAAPLRV